MAHFLGRSLPKLISFASILADKSELLKVLLDVRHEVHLLRQDTAQVLANQDQLAVHIAQLEQAQRPLLDAPVPPPVFILPLATMEDLEAAERRLIHPADQAVLFFTICTRTTSGLRNGETAYVQLLHIQVLPKC